ncbi:hypothetical protein LOZ58_002951 [Ophidiomyces ophidiicola]|nr:hypothetical protein LOZ65_005851 [Ophidiomyces ophidiicola]KAI1938906.1 hypothetical protein LOZ66_002981 [Ophidiomyces ophidiicola]KAI1961876.1 hypothetical protein LOZ58_002951 [Ophidiomyces ophidiicola]
MADHLPQKQASLEPAVEIAIPETPIEARSGQSTPSDELPANTLGKNGFISPSIPASSSDITPPPSQSLGNISTPRRRSLSQSNSLLASPPATVDQTLCVAYGASESLPTLADIDTANDEPLRIIAKELLSVAQESRMSAAHFKLQHSLLSMTSSEAIKRAEVEQQLAKREIEILQSAEYRLRQTQHAKSPPSPLPTPQQQQNTMINSALNRAKELEEINLVLERKLRHATKIIEEDADKYELLMEENCRLKKRIRDNRDHFTLMMDHGSLSSSPRTEIHTPQQKLISRYPDSARSHVSRVGGQDPFAVLLAADQVLHGEATSIKSSLPSKSGHRGHGHIRGTHSLSSLPITPQRRSGAVERIHFFTPINQRSTAPPVGYPIIHDRDDTDRHDRDSTISVSDVDEAVTDEDVPASQASSLATSMLRRFPGASQEEPQVPANIGKSSTLLQAKLFGHIKKPGVERSTDNLKRKRSHEAKTLSPKKVRTMEPIYINMKS